VASGTRATIRAFGEAICPDCFDYRRCALWNHNAGRLFRRTRTYVERELARQAGVTQKAAREQVRVSDVKVAEFQRRGVAHFHRLWRLDAAGDELAAPPAPYRDARSGTDVQGDARMNGFGLCDIALGGEGWTARAAMRQGVAGLAPNQDR
jgi:hypothetical protein